LEALEQARREGGGSVFSAGRERRRGRRRRVGSALNGWVDAGAVRWAGTLVNLSPCGAALRLPEELAVGTQLRLGLRETGARARVAEIPARVVRVSRASAGGGGTAWDTSLDFAAVAEKRHDVVELLAVVPDSRGRSAES
jgi:hypothetical protein